MHFTPLKQQNEFQFLNLYNKSVYINFIVPFLKKKKVEKTYRKIFIRNLTWFYPQQKKYLKLS